MKFSYKVINPNPIEDTADFILKMLIDSNTSKVEQAITTYVDSSSHTDIAV